MTNQITLYQVRDSKTSAVLMVAPMSTIRQAFDIDPMGVTRILTKCREDLGIASCHFNNRPTSVATSGSVLIAKWGTEMDLVRI